MRSTSLGRPYRRVCARRHCVVRLSLYLARWVFIGLRNGPTHQHHDAYPGNGETKYARHDAVKRESEKTEQGKQRSPNANQGHRHD